jgi:putative ABC transport system permease protein
MILFGQLRVLRLGLKSLLLHKLRTSLTTLGIMFGVFSVIAMLAIGEGASWEAQQQIKELGSTNIMLTAKKPPATEQSSTGSQWSAIAYGLTFVDQERIQKTLPAVHKVVPVRQSRKEFRVEDEWHQGYVLGTTPDFLDVMRMQVGEGRWMTPRDLELRANVVVLGALAARSLFPIDDPIGRTIKADTDRFEVVGVLDYLGRASGGIGPSLDECVYIPESTSRSWFGINQVRRSSGSFESERVELHNIVVQLEDPEQVLDTARVVRGMLSEAHKKGDYEVLVPLELLKRAEETTRIFTILLSFIAGISLLVGGIGIMNVMLATVTERTREIGIRRALGARKRNIVSQFLVETVVISLAGGLLGVLLGRTAPQLVEHFFQMKALPRIEHSVLAFAVSAIVGVVFGIYPAWRAANMDPVEALRHE